MSAPNRRSSARSDRCPDSPARVEPPTRPPWRVGLVQQRWHPDPAEHRAALRRRRAHGRAARARGSSACRSSRSRRTSRSRPTGPAPRASTPEPLPGGPTYEFAAELAAETGVPVHASLYERADDDGARLQHRDLRRARRRAARPDPQDAPAGHRRATTRTATSRPGDTGYPVVEVADARLGFPTCWDEWFPEVARAYALHGAEVIVYPTAIGSEPDHPEFDTEPLWEQVIRAHGIANGTFMVVPNRIGTEGPITFYGSSFVSDPYGRVLVQAPRDEPAVLVADLDLDQRRDWLALFPFLATRRPDTYGPLVEAEPRRDA